jgi:transcriptional regulator with PAS, ATPase and Fis domain
LFLDEVAELPLELQAKLLRVLETRQVLPVGGTMPVSVDVRVLSATHRALRKEAEAGRFRADLMYRLRVIPIFLPPLRDRTEDVALLARAFVDELNQRGSRRHVESISAEALGALARWPWPGNVRELRNAIQYAFALGDGPVLRSTDLPPEILDGRAVDDEAQPASAHAEPPSRARIEEALQVAHGRRDAAAAALGVSRVTLWRWMREHGIAVQRRRRR